MVRDKRKGSNTGKKIQYSVLFLMALLVGAFMVVGGPFAAFGSSGDSWDGMMTINSAYYPGSAGLVRNDLFSTDSMTIDADGESNPIAFWHDIIWNEDKYFDVLTQSSFTGTTQLESNIYNYEEGYFNAMWYLDFVDYPTMQPKVEWSISGMEQVNADATPTDYIVLDGSGPSRSYDQNEQHIEEYYYRFVVSTSVEASKISPPNTVQDRFKLYISCSDGVGRWLDFKDVYDIAPIEDAFVILDIDTSHTGDDIISVASDIRTFGAPTPSFYEDGQLASYSTVKDLITQPGTTTVSLLEQKLIGGINNIYFQAGFDSYAGLNPVSSVNVPGLVDDGSDYYQFGFDWLGVPTWFERHIAIGVDTEDWRVFDVTIETPLLAKIIVTGVISDDDDTTTTTTTPTPTEPITTPPITTTPTGPTETATDWFDLDEWGLRISEWSGDQISPEMGVVVFIVGIGILVIFFVRRS